MLLSDEQQHIVKRVSTGNNIIVDAVAGTGKTTLILHIAKELHSKQILQMTYNKSLKFEVREKIENANINNLSVHTFHSLAVHYYSNNAHIDNEIRKIIVENKTPIKPIPKIDILVLDESQDMTFLYFQLMCKFIFDMNSNVQLLILGDYMQGLYEFKGSDIRYLTFADYIWEKHPMLNTPNFEICSMKMSYRISNQIRHFVNNVLIGDNRMNSCRDDQPVQYIRNTRYNIEKIVYAEIIKLLGIGIRPTDIFILAPSMKGGRSNIRKLENLLVEKNIPCHVPMNDSIDIDQRIIDGKVVFSTFHTVKGRQRKYVFVLGMDNSYFKYYARDLSKNKCPNTIYVACTRASHGLYVLENDSNPDDRPLEFIKMTHIEMKQQPYINFKGQHKTLFHITDEEISSQSLIKTTPTELIKFIPEESFQSICNMLEQLFIIENPNEYLIDMPNIIETTTGQFEDISDLNGIAIPCVYYDHLKSIWNNTEIEDIKDSTLYELINYYYDENKKHNNFIQSMIERLPDKITSISDYLFMANINQAIQESLYFKLKQIDSYNWLSSDMVDICNIKYQHTISPDCQNNPPIIENYIITSNDHDKHRNIDTFTKSFLDNKYFRFTARADIITDTTLWELKCTNNITTENMLQLVIYTWIWNMSQCDREHITNFKIFNVKTGELLKLIVNMDIINDIMKLLLISRYEKNNPKHDSLFIDDCHNYINSFNCLDG